MADDRRGATEASYLPSTSDPDLAPLTQCEIAPLKAPNADHQRQRLGRSAAETNAALRCYKAGRVTSVSAMVFMRDSERASELARSDQLDVGLHLNFAEPFTSAKCPVPTREAANKVEPLLDVG